MHGFQIRWFDSLSLHFIPSSRHNFRRKAKVSLEVTSISFFDIEGALGNLFNYSFADSHVYFVCLDTGSKGTGAGTGTGSKGADGDSKQAIRVSSAGGRLSCFFRFGRVLFRV